MCFEWMGGWADGQQDGMTEGSWMSDEKKQVTITIKSSGSISIEGDVVLQDRDGNLIPRPPEKHPGILKLCACGHSKNKPAMGHIMKLRRTYATLPPPPQP
jgi:hypothetical protein